MNKDFRLFHPDKKVFIMRDHNWAFAAWEIARLKRFINKGASLYHIDSHIDYCDPEMELGQINDEETALKLASEMHIFEFIIPSYKIGTVKNIFMISDDNVKECGEEVQRAYTLNHFESCFRRKWYDLSEETSNILDLDLDYFNTNYKDSNSNPVLLSEDIIRYRLNYFKESMLEWDITTVAISPEYCGGNEAARYLYNIFLDEYGIKEEELIEW